MSLFQSLAPRLAGASIRERLIGTFGALLGIGLTGLICGLAGGSELGIPSLVAPIGATALLLFIVPSSPLAQPWSVVGGNSLSALTGVVVVHFIPQSLVADAVSVSGAIAVMSLTRCLHPPGAAVALLVALMGPEGAAGSFMFALMPVGLNSLVLVCLAYGFHKLSGQRYPYLAQAKPVSPHGTADPHPQARRGLSDADIDAAINESGSTFDISKGDLVGLIRRAERAAVERVRDVPRCEDVMSKDVLIIAPEAPVPEARALLLERGLRILPVVGAQGKVEGAVGLRNLEDPLLHVGDVMGWAMIAGPSDSVLSLVDKLTDGRTHAVVIADDERQLLGLITQTDLIIALTRLAVSNVVT